MSDEESTAGPGGAATPSAGRPSVNAFPLLPTDPPRIGRWWLDARLVARPSGVAFLAHADGQASTMLILLSRGAAGDAAARDRLAGEINRMSEDTVIARGGQGQDQGRLAHLFVSQADDPVGPGHAATAPWTVLAWDDSDNALREADRLLRSVDLSGSPELGTPSGPGFSLPWIGHSTPGNWRLWPPSWPDRKDRTGWVPMLASWLLMILAATLALLIAVLIFQNPPPGVGGGGGASGSGSASGTGSASSSEGSGTEPSSGSPSGSGSGSGSPSSSGGQGSPTKTPSMNAPGQGSATTTQSATPQQSRL